ncbi:MAG TPA: alkaline phosphatase family protein, partial [Acidimicrobiales bacterium]
MLCALVGVVSIAAACSSSGPSVNSAPLIGIHKIEHVIIINQENRSFDNYFGTYPGADGIPMANGVPTVCSPNETTQTCDKPFHDHNFVNGGGPHGARSFAADVNGGKMDGFVGQAIAGSKIKACVTNPQNPACTNSQNPDVMGWHDGREIPNYWAYAQNFVLQDHMFEPTTGWSLPSHLFSVSGWSAKCRTIDDPMSCKAAAEPAQTPDFHPFTPAIARGPTPNYAWTDLTYLLHQAKVSWNYFVTPGSQPDCAQDEAVDCKQPGQNAGTPGIWNPLPFFTTVHQDNELGNIRPTQDFLDQAHAGTLPAV